MTIAIHPDIAPPARLTAAETIDVIDAADIVDLVDLFWPEAVEIDVAHTTRVTAGAVSILADGLPRARATGQDVTIKHARPLVELLLTITGILEIDDDELVDERAA